MERESIKIVATDRHEVSGMFDLPSRPGAGLIFAHGAGAGMEHAFMEAVAARLATRDIAVLRFQFPYMERGRKAPDRPPVLIPTVRAACAAARSRLPELAWFAGGKSMGGRMTTTADSEEPLGVRGIVLFGFPLHAPGKPGSSRGAHLVETGAPLLFLQGTRDKLCDLDLLRPLLPTVPGGATLHVVDAADHGFHVTKRSGRTDEEALDELTETAVAWIREHA